VVEEGEGEELRLYCPEEAVEEETAQNQQPAVLPEWAGVVGVEL
jgi:hypothetical protein